MMKRFLLALCFIVCIQFLTAGQVLSRTITGTVKSKTFQIIPNVIVQEKGRDNVTVTDSIGHYELTVQEDATIIFSISGYRTKYMHVAEMNYFDVTLDSEFIQDQPVQVGYGIINALNNVGCIAAKTDDNFNRGNVIDPTQLWQAKIAGLSVNNRGGNPNVEGLMRTRGISSFDPDAAPLIVIDGVPLTALGGIDPTDIASVTVLKDGASASIYGMRGSNGVILVTTKRGSSAKSLTVTFQSEIAASTVRKKQPVLNAQEYVAVGGNNIGSSTNWQDEITRTGMSSSQHLVISASDQNSSFRLATHLRSVNGILLHSGFDQINTRVNATHKALDDRLRFSFNMAITNRNIDYSFPEAFRYANIFNPTAPVRFSNGEYFQAVIFDNYNPVALLNQNINEGKRKTINYGGSIAFDIIKDLTVTFNVAQQSVDNFKGSYYSRESFYIGLNRGGLAQRYSDESYFTFAESYLTYQKTTDKFAFKVVEGYSFQKDRMESFGAQLGNFPSDELGYDALKYSADVLSGQPNLINIFSNSTPTNRIAAGFFRANFSIGNAVTFQGSMRYEGSSKLGNNRKTGLFSSFGTNVNALHFLKKLKWQQLNVRLAYGTTGSIPTQSGLALDKFEYNFNNGGTLVKVRDSNPNLKWEHKGELNIGVDLQVGPVSATLDFYHRTIKDLIQQRYVDPAEYPSGIRYENSASLTGKGLEVALQYNPIRLSELRYIPSLVVSANRTIVKDYPIGQELHGYNDAPGASSSQMVRIAVGQRFGQIWSPVYKGVDSNGNPVFKDVSGDGVIQVNPFNALDPDTDYEATGYAQPTWELGWGNMITYRNWQLNAFLRGAFGHSLVNIMRLAYEPLDAGAIDAYNRVRTSKAVEGLLQTRYSSLYVERADFLTLDNISLQYSFNLKTHRYINSLKLYSTVQGLFTITNYSGTDPQPVWIDESAAVGTYSIGPDSLSPGLDRNGNYLPARTFTLGFSIGF